MTVPHRFWAAVRETAARGFIPVSGNGGQAERCLVIGEMRAGAGARVGVGHCGQKLAGIGVGRMTEQRIRRGVFNQSSPEHDANVVGQLSDHREIM